MPSIEDLEKLNREYIETLRNEDRIELEKQKEKMKELAEQLKEPKIKAERKPILCLDFDGVCHSYTSGWKGANVIPDPPVDGLFEFLVEAQRHFEIHIFSTRSLQEGGIEAMAQWFDEYKHEWDNRSVDNAVPAFLPLHFPLEKPPALVTLDDRAITFTGVFPDMETLKNFKPWNKK